MPKTTFDRSIYITCISTIDISSIIMTSFSISSLSSVVPHPTSLCMVLASIFVCSDILFAALPVGARSTISEVIYFFIYFMIMSNVVVLPTPGPPVIIIMSFLTALNTAFLCESSSSLPFSFSISFIFVIILLSLSCLLILD